MEKRQRIEETLGRAGILLVTSVGVGHLTQAVSVFGLSILSRLDDLPSFTLVSVSKDLADSFHFSPFSFVAYAWLWIGSAYISQRKELRQLPASFVLCLGGAMTQPASALLSIPLSFSLIPLSVVEPYMHPSTWVAFALSGSMTSLVIFFLLKFMRRSKTAQRHEALETSIGGNHD